MIKILMNSPIPPVKSGLASKMWYNTFKSISKIEGILGENKEKWPKSLSDLSEDIDSSEIAFSSFGLAIAYLENWMNEHLLKLFDYHTYDPSKMLNSKMILDSQALEHLQILEVRTSTSVTTNGSLISLIDDTRTPFGKRLLKKWVSAPLLRIEDINSRLDSVEDLINHPHEFDVIRTKLLKLNDMEKQLSKLYQYSINRNRKAIYFEDVSLKKLKEFHDILCKMKEIPEYIESLSKKKDEFKSERLRQLVTINKNKEDSDSEEQSENFENLNDPKGLFPNIEDELKEFEAMVSWKKVGNERIPEPCKGIDQTFDEANEIVNTIKSKFEDILKSIRAKFNNDPNM